MSNHTLIARDSSRRAEKFTHANLSEQKNDCPGLISASGLGMRVLACARLHTTPLYRCYFISILGSFHIASVCGWMPNNETIVFPFNQSGGHFTCAQVQYYFQLCAKSFYRSEYAYNKHCPPVNNATTSLFLPAKSNSYFSLP